MVNFKGLISQNKVIDASFKTFTKKNVDLESVMITALSVLPFIAVTKSFESALGMGLFITSVLVLTMMTFSLIKTYIPESLSILIYFIIISTEVTILKLFMDAFLPKLAFELGVFASLFVINAFIVTRSHAFVSQHSVFKSAKEALRIGLKVLVFISIIGLFRELFGTGVIEIGYIFPLPFQFTLFQQVGLQPYAMDVFSQAPGAFLMTGFILSIYIAFNQSREVKTWNT